MNEHFIVMILLFSGRTTQAQQRPVSVMDFVKFKEGKNAETLFFYENNRDSITFL